MCSIVISIFVCMQSCTSRIVAASEPERPSASDPFSIPHVQSSVVLATLFLRLWMCHVRVLDTHESGRAVTAGSKPDAAWVVDGLVGARELAAGRDRVGEKRIEASPAVA